MSTTTTSPPSGTAPTSAGRDSVRQRRLAQLLGNREKLAVASAAFEAHRLGDGSELDRVQYLVEAAIKAEFPAMYERLFAGWLRRDAELVHTGEPVADCPICGLAGTTADRTPSAA